MVMQKREFVDGGHTRCDVRFLYKVIIKLFKGLTEELQIVGYGYVRDEFKRHRSYAVSITEQLKLKGIILEQFGAQLYEDGIDQVRAGQLYQLYELMTAAKE
ncbi:succinate dehydrogenase assembly factor 3, mitochondrial-like [Schistocerca serialis cubense]|uniref:succinate dehydrogenase assembly factor 3, mitochondrial-like n=1 Tax=Schistocerca serialis cubense TaxID=2023355 RepID=UPI00214DF115|nr:succinate dehydrogenase assembly factor 3, mitochondrial-like [Schistocerca serialis cubense]